MKKVYLLSLIAALTVGIAVYLFASSLQRQMQPVSESTGYVVVATEDIPANTLISEQMVAVIQCPKSSIHPLAATSLDQVVGLITKVPLSAQEQVFSLRLGEKGDEKGQLSYVLADGQRAVSVAVDDVAGVSGYINKGDRVDVVATIILPSNGEMTSQPVSTLLVENLLVLETGLKQIGAADSNTSIYQTVTLSATPEQVLKINYAATNGKMRLVLRPILDQGTAADIPDYPPLPSKVIPDDGVS